MHFLDYLKNAEGNIRVDESSTVHFDYRLDENSVRVEYRLICSGMFYPAHFLGDWSHSDAARILLSLPVELLVASRPYDDYPQELVLRFVARRVIDTDGIYYADEEIASDLAALLTLLCRRLVTISVKVREQHHTVHAPPILADCPIPAATTFRYPIGKNALFCLATAWRESRLKATILHPCHSRQMKSCRIFSLFRN